MLGHGGLPSTESWMQFLSWCNGLILCPFVQAKLYGTDLVSCGRLGMLLKLLENISIFLLSFFLNAYNIGYCNCIYDYNDDIVI